MTMQILEAPQFKSNPKHRELSQPVEIAKLDIASEPYARCIAASQKVRWDIEKDVIRGRTFDVQQKFLPDGLSKVQELEFLTAEEKRYLSQIQGRTYANVFHMAERFVNAKVLEISHDHTLGNQTALEALVRFSDEELKHQEMFRRLERLAGAQMAPGYTFLPDPNEVAKVVLGKSTWAVLALTLHIELVTQVHYRQSIDLDPHVSPLFKDTFRYHWLEESQHAILDELEWKRADKNLSVEARDRAVDEFIELVGAVDGVLHIQAKADAEYFVRTCGRQLLEDQPHVVEQGVLKAYRWQHIISGAQQPHFIKVLSSLITENQGARIQKALASIV
jgi:DNA-binding protein Fis